MRVEGGESEHGPRRTGRLSGGANTGEEALRSGRIWDIIVGLDVFDIDAICSVHRSCAYVTISGT